jgi:L-alanine-DL-glutamate epimerase-like enolase superfamily enzyme
MTRSACISVLELGYGGGLVLHTATSGAVPTLRELRLVIEQDGQVVALGASRTNIAYLSGLPAEAVEAEVTAVASALDWQQPWGGLVAQMDAAFPALCAPARMLFEMAAADGGAREAGQPLWQWLGGTNGTAASDTNQTLFWEDSDRMLARAQAYAARGFLQLKLRIGVGGFPEDLARLRMLRAHLGPAARLSVDVNGRWNAEAAPAHLGDLAGLRIEYVEQPLPAEDWQELRALSAASPIPIMLDESLSSPSAIARMAAEGTAQLAHLKLAKLGGLDRLMAAAGTLHAAGIGLMVGQMNEGVISTLAATHAAIALSAPLRELYGADALLHDPAQPAPAYAEGCIHLPPGSGLGVIQSRLPPGATLLWTSP